MIRVAAALLLLTVPASAQGGQVSEAGTAFMRHCLADVTEARVALLKEKAPDFAATLSEEQLVEGARQKAMRACPCFLHIIGVSPLSEGGTPEEKVASVVAWLGAEDGMSMPPVLATVTKNCGERSSVLPPRWLGR